MCAWERAGPTDGRACACTTSKGESARAHAAPTGTRFCREGKVAHAQGIHAAWCEFHDENHDESRRVLSASILRQAVQAVSLLCLPCLCLKNYEFQISIPPAREVTVVRL